MASNLEKETITSLYVHFPFCETKCHYCDFFSLPEKQVDLNSRADIYGAIAGELELYSDKLSTQLKTVFLGGGTPSLVPLEILQSFLSKLQLAPDAEVTMEANPSSITQERATAWRSFGVNRISMGVQALDDQRLEWLGRVHSKSKAYEALDALFSAGFDNVSTDYIVGVPAQSEEHIESELKDLLSNYPKIRHLSAYLLTLKGSNSKFKELPSEDEQLAHLRCVSRFLQMRGFEQYEISNFAKPGFRARHNENYWLGGSYLGIGPSAHSFWATQRKRTKNWASLGKYRDLINQKTLPIEWDEQLSCEQERLEYLMLRLRRAEGMSITEYDQRFGQSLLTERGALINTYKNNGLCQILENDKLRLTADGFFLSDQILSKIS
jgi:oxygen-independent coproporphyrinogen-3 oxidase